MSQPRKMLKSSSTLQNGNWSLLCLFNLELGPVCAEIHRFVEYTPRKCFNSFVQATVDAIRQKVENPNSSVVAGTINLLANSFFGNQIIDRMRHTLTKNLNHEKTNAAII